MPEPRFERGRLFDQSVIVPLELADATDDEVRLKINCTQVAVSPVFNPDGYFELPGGRQGHVKSAEAIQTETGGTSGATQLVLTLRAGHSMACHDRHAGQVGLLLFAPQGQVRHFAASGSLARAGCHCSSGPGTRGWACRSSSPWGNDRGWE